MSCLCCSRRHFLTRAAAALVLANTPSWTWAASPVACASLGGGGDVDHYVRKASSGNPNLDAAVIGELRKILAVIPVAPEFHFIDDAPPNSFALPTSDVLGTNGTVLLGLNLLNALLDGTDPDLSGGGALAGICAHECAHIYQFITGCYDRLSQFGLIAVELHADLIAGYYLGKRAGDAKRANDTEAQKAAAAQSVDSFSKALFTRTGFNYTDPTFHGTPGDRISCVDRGYLLVQQGVSLTDASSRGEDFVKNFNPVQ